MSDSARHAWSEVGDRFTSWGRRVADRYEGSGSTDTQAQESSREIERVAREVIDGITRGVSAIGETLRDREATEELKSAVGALGDAITATVSEATDGIRSRGSVTGNGSRPDAEEKSDDEATSGDASDDDGASGPDDTANPDDGGTPPPAP